MYNIALSFILNSIYWKKNQNFKSVQMNVYSFLDVSKRTITPYTIEV